MALEKEILLNQARLSLQEEEAGEEKAFLHN